MKKDHKTSRLENALLQWDDGPYMKFLQPSADILIEQSHVKQGDFLLDVGCGFGDPILDIADIVGLEGKLVGIDHDEESILIAKKRADDRNLQNIVLETGEVPELLFEEGYFNSVISRNVILYFGDPLPFLVEQKRVLKKNGRIAITVWGVSDKNPLMNLPMKVLRSYTNSSGRAVPNNKNRVDTSDPNILANLLARAGFTDVQSGIVELSFPGDSSDAELYWDQRLAGSPMSQKILSELSEIEQEKAENAALNKVKSLIESGNATGQAVWVSGTKK